MSEACFKLNLTTQWNGKLSSYILEPYFEANDVLMSEMHVHLGNSELEINKWLLSLNGNEFSSLHINTKENEIRIFKNHAGWGVNHNDLPKHLNKNESENYNRFINLLRKLLQDFK